MIIDLGPLTIKLDVLVIQIINILILLWIFKALFGKTLIDEVAKRRAMTLKLHQAEEEYEALLAKAHEEKEAIILEALARKQQLIQEAQRLWDKEKQSIIDKATKESDRIISKAQQDADTKQRDLDAHFAQWVKTTAMTMVKKLLQSNPTINKEYVEWLAHEFVVSHKRTIS